MQWLISFALVAAAAAVQQPFPFADFRTFRCEFRDGEGRIIAGSKTTDRRGDRFTEPLTIDNVNYKARSARLVGNAGGSDLTLLRDGQLAVTFAEYTPPGGVSIITIYKHPVQFDVYRAVMSRHLVFTVREETLSMTQYYGTCRGLP